MISAFLLLQAAGDIDKYDYLKLPAYDTWGVIMPKNAPLAAKEYITPSDLADLPLIVSRQAVNQELTSWGQQHNIHFDIACTYNLVFNAAIMAEPITLFLTPLLWQKKVLGMYYR